MKLIHNWKQAWRFDTTRLFLFVAILPPLWAEIPQDAKDAIPAAWQPWIITGIGILGAVLRLRDQGPAK
ncbi:MAG: hypothetical protein IPM06_20105 [Rhizobiales bacterium]|nr:hypothetical protein [Hyphomicrobiales bacterium]